MGKEYLSTSMMSQQGYMLHDALNLTFSQTMPSIDEDVDVLNRRKRRKTRRVTVNVKKQTQMAQNEKMVAWKLASRMLGYFRPTAFQQLPAKGTESWQKIWDERSRILNQYWKLACDAALSPDLKWIDCNDVDSLKTTKKKEWTDQQQMLKATLQTDQYKDVQKIQRTLLSEIYKNQRKKQDTRVVEAWEQAKHDVGTVDSFVNLPNRGTKTFKDMMADEATKELYDRTKTRQREILDEKVR